MQELGDGPLGRGVTLSTVFAEQPQMPIFRGMASSAVEGLARGAFIELIGHSNAQPCFQRFLGGCAGSVSSRGARECARAYFRQLHVIQRSWADVRAQMLDVARCTLANARVKRGRLTTEQSFSIGMARGAFRDRHADGRLVARFATIVKVGVPG